jgi:tRNA A-37 threonylcarbamoyl transferase component Bud32
MTPAMCPHEEELADYVLGKLPEQDARQVATHVVRCPACQCRLHTIDAASDVLVGYLRRPWPAEDKPDPHLARMLQGAEALANAGFGSAATALPPQTVERSPVLAPAEHPDELGRLNHYRVLELLGRGGMGVVYVAEDTQLRRRVALKVMSATLAQDKAARSRFLREARAQAALSSHPHIAPIYEVGEADGVPYLAMELLHGETLARRLRLTGGAALPLGEAIRIGAEVAAGLAAAHDRGLIHRDVKPGNIWLAAEDGRVRLLDFGLARTGGDEPRLTQPGVVLGTPAYMAPEQAAGQAVTFKADLFSLGCVLYHLCTGTPPFKGTRHLETLQAVVTDQPRPVADVNAGVPLGLAALIGRLLAKAPEDRRTSARAVAIALQALLRQTTATAPTGLRDSGVVAGVDEGPVPGHRARPTSRKRRLFIGLGGVAAALLLAGVALVLTGLADKEGPGEAAGSAGEPALGGKAATTPKTHNSHTARQQARSLGVRLRRLNPGFDGSIQYTTGPSAGLWKVSFLTDAVTDISPLAGLTDLKVLTCAGSAPGKGRLKDLSPLRTLTQLTHLECQWNRIEDLSPLRELALTNLVCDFNPGRDTVVMRSLTSLARINGVSAKKFWKAAGKPS